MRFPRIIACLLAAAAPALAAGRINVSGDTHLRIVGDTTVATTGGSNLDIATSGNVTITSGTGTLTVNGNVTIAIGAQLDINVNGAMVNVGGNFTNNGTLVSDVGGTLQMNGTSSQTITTGGVAEANDFVNVIVNNTGASSVVSTVGAIKVDGQVTVTDADFRPVTASDFNNVQIDAAGVFTGPASGAMTVSGSWVNNGSWVPNGCTVTFDGTASQAFSGSSSSNFPNTTIAASATLSVSNTMTVDGTLTVNGTLELNNSAILKLGTSAVGGTLSVATGGTLRSTSGSNNKPTITAVNTGFRHSTTISGTASINGLIFEYGNADGLRVAAGATVNLFNNIAFQNASTAAGAAHVTFQLNGANLIATGCSFDSANGSSPANVEASAAVTTSYYQFTTLNGGAGTGEANDSDNDTNVDGVVDVAPGGVVDWVYSGREALAGTPIGTPRLAWDFSTLAFYASYYAFKDHGGATEANSDRVWALDSNGQPKSATYFYDVSQNYGDIVGGLWWFTEGTTHTVYFGTSGGWLFRIEDTGSGFVDSAGYPMRPVVEIDTADSGDGYTYPASNPTFGYGGGASSESFPALTIDSVGDSTSGMLTDDGGGASTRWTWDFGTSASATFSIRWNGTGAGGGSKTWELEASTDAVSWNPIVSRPSPFALTTDSFTGTYRYVRIVLTRATAGTLNSDVFFVHKSNGTTPITAITSEVRADGTNIYFGCSNGATNYLFKVADSTQFTKFAKSPPASVNTRPDGFVSGGVTYMYAGAGANFIRTDDVSGNPTDSLAGVVETINAPPFVRASHQHIFVGDAAGNMHGGQAAASGFPKITANWPYTPGAGGAVAGRPTSDFGGTNRVIWGDGSGRVHVLNAGADPPAAVTGWPVQYDGGAAMNYAALYRGGFVYIGNANGKVLVINFTTQALVREYNLGAQVLDIIYDWNNGKIIALTTSGKLVYLQPVDTTAPSSSFSFPTNGQITSVSAFMNGQDGVPSTSDDAKFKGTASDPSPASGVTFTQIAIQRLSDLLWFDGADFTSATKVWLAATITSGSGTSNVNWEFYFNAGAFPDDTYQADVRSRDAVGNQEP